MPKRRNMHLPEVSRIARAGAALLCLIAVLGFAAGTAVAQGKRDLKSVEKDIRRGERRADILRRQDSGLKKEIARLRARMVASARAVQNREAALSRLEKKLGNSKRLEAAARRSMQARRAEIAATLAALQRLALRPPESLIAGPREANAQVRIALMLRATLPGLERRIAAAKRRAATLATARAAGARRGAAIRRASARLAGDRARLAGLVGKHRSLRRQTTERRARASARLRALAAEASGLRDLLRRVQRQARARPAAHTGTRQPPGPRPKLVRIFSAAGGRMALPVRGRIVRRFGQKTASGAGSKGIVIQARRGAQVVATFDGRIVFAGPFRDYGQILIIDHGGGYHTLIAGLWRIDVSVNQRLVANQPVGVMSLTQSDNTKLYLEIRRNGQPINPLPLVAAKNG